MSAVTNTVTSDITLCGSLAYTKDIILNESNASERITKNVFNNKFNTFIDLKFFDIDKYWKMYVSLNFAEGLIRLRPRTKVNVRAFVH